MLEISVYDVMEEQLGWAGCDDVLIQMLSIIVCMRGMQKIMIFLSPFILSLTSGRSYYQYYISYTRIIVITKHPSTHPSFLAASIHCILGLCSVKYILIRIKIFGDCLI